MENFRQGVVTLKTPILIGGCRSGEYYDRLIISEWRSAGGEFHIRTQASLAPSGYEFPNGRQSKLYHISWTNIETLSLNLHCILLSADDQENDYFTLLVKQGILESLEIGGDPEQYSLATSLVNWR